MRMCSCTVAALIFSGDWKYFFPSPAERFTYLRRRGVCTVQVCQRTQPEVISRRCEWKCVRVNCGRAEAEVHD